MNSLIPAVQMLYRAMDVDLFAPSVRSGIHVHANVAPLDALDLVQVMRSYAVLEPLLFRFVGVQREQNIYCVPLYRAVNERRLWVQIAALLNTSHATRNTLIALHTKFRDACKYSALNIGPVIRLATVQFRHAPTFDDEDVMLRWLRLVDATVNFRFPSPARIEHLESVRAVMQPLLPRFDWAEYVREVEARGLLGFANSLLPCTYKVGNWGKPAGMAFEARIGRAPNREAVMPHDDRLRWIITEPEEEEAMERELNDALAEQSNEDTTEEVA